MNRVILFLLGFVTFLLTAEAQVYGPDNFTEGQDNYLCFVRVDGQYMYVDGEDVKLSDDFPEKETDMANYFWTFKPLDRNIYYIYNKQTNGPVGYDYDVKSFKCYQLKRDSVAYKFKIERWYGHSEFRMSILYNYNNILAKNGMLYVAPDYNDIGERVKTTPVEFLNIRKTIQMRRDEREKKEQERIKAEQERLRAEAEKERLAKKRIEDSLKFVELKKELKIKQTKSSAYVRQHLVGHVYKGNVTLNNYEANMVISAMVTIQVTVKFVSVNKMIMSIVGIPKESRNAAEQAMMRQLAAKATNEVEINEFYYENGYICEMTAKPFQLFNNNQLMKMNAGGMSGNLKRIR